MSALERRKSKEPELRIRLLGRFEVLRSGEPIPEEAWGRRKTRTLLKVLLTQRGRVFMQDQLIELLYGDTEPQKKLGNLYGRISQLRHALEPGLARGSESRYILRIGGGYCFSTSTPIYLDTEVFRERMTSGQQAQETGHWQLAAESYEKALELYRGEFLEADRYEEWSLGPREEWQEEYLAGLCQLAECYAEIGDNKKAIKCCNQVLSIQPTREAAIRSLMQYYYVAGEDSRALGTFETGKKALREQLEVEPSAETSVLCERIRQCSLPRRPRVPDPLRIAVMPFVNLCPDPEDEYFVDGITEELIYALSKVREFKVIAQTSVLAYKGARRSIKRIGQELRVGTVVEGSVRRADSRLRITAQLVDVDTEEHMWSGEYDRDLDDVFVIQTEIAREVTKNLCRHLPASSAVLPTIRYREDMEAYRLYLEGRYFLSKRFEDSFQKACESFERALEIDDGFALAHAGLSFTVWLLALYGLIPREEGIARAQSEAEVAISIDDTASEAYATLGCIRSMFHLDPRGAETHFKRGVEADPQNVEIRHVRGLNLVFQGEFSTAIDCYEQALEIDPLSSIVTRGLGYALYHAHRFEEALSQFQRAVRLEKHDMGVYGTLGQVYRQMNQYEKAREALDQAVGIHRRTLSYVGFDELLHAHVREIMGEKGALQQMVERMEAENQRPALVSLGHFLLEDADAGFEWLERAREARDGMFYLWVLQEPLMDAYKSDSRHRGHLLRLGLKPA